MFFCFFQAEDGIRDYKVTGVQTCALPISISSSSVTVLDDLDIVYIAHASLNRAIRLTAGAGSRYPLYPTSMGRVLLAFQTETAIEAYFDRAMFRKLTEHTETDPASLRRLLKAVRA